MSRIRNTAIERHLNLQGLLYRLPRANNTAAAIFYIIEDSLTIHKEIVIYNVIFFLIFLRCLSEAALAG
jgi:hypothetical protein